MSFPYPDKPWEDGQQAYYYNADGTVTIGTYNAAEDRWEMEVISINTDNEFIDTQHVLLINPTQDPLQEAQDFTAPYADPLPSITTQYDANQALLQETVLSAKNTARVGDLLDFTQNTAVQGYWVHTQDEGGAPQEAEFYAYDEDGNNTTQFADIRLIKFNDNGLAANPGTENVLATARVGDQLVMQELGQNHFGQYIIETITTYNTDDVIYREFGVKVYKQGQRAFGDVNYLAHCAVRVMRPEVVIVQDDQPVVSDRGVLWYRESDDHLFISNYADGYIGQGAQWTDLTASGGGGDGVHVGELPPAEEEGALWFDTSRLELYVYYVEGEDGGWLPSSPLGARVSAGEILQQQILSRVDSIETDYVGINNSNDVTTSFRIKADGKTLISTSGNELGLYHVKDPTNGNDEWAATKGYVDSKIGGGGGSFQDKYDGNRECVANATSVTTLSSGQVMFLNNQLVSTTQPALVEAIGLPLDEFNWASCIKSGVIKVTNGIYEAGYYQVYKTKETNGRNMLVYVTSLWFDVDQSLQAGGTPCYFQGVFFE